ncbi:MAG: hypothetical protein GY788_12390 [bacterium]|nr:hypothetical protein [bacterium]
MGRIRSIHPGVFTDEVFVDLSEPAQVLWFGLWTEADDKGVFEWKPTRIRMRLRPTKDGDVEELLAELAKYDCIRKYELDGRHYGAIRNFGEFQRPRKPNSLYPIPRELHRYVALRTPVPEPPGFNTPPVPQKSGNAQQMEGRGDTPSQEEQNSDLDTYVSGTPNVDTEGSTLSAAVAKNGRTA